MNNRELKPVGRYSIQRQRIARLVREKNEQLETLQEVWRRAHTAPVRTHTIDVIECLCEPSAWTGKEMH